MIFAVTGTRQGMTPMQQTRFCDLIEAGLKRNKVFLHGGCIGVDTEAHDLLIAAGYPKFRIEVYPSTIKNTQGRKWLPKHYKVHDPKRPLARNEIMMERADVIVAMPKGMIEERRSGTWHAIRCARRLRKRPFKITKTILIIWPDGTVKEDDG